jgi:shikimate kinase
VNRSILLVGLPGSGASTVGGFLATRLGLPYLDDEALMERTAGMTSAALRESGGDEALRKAESRVLTLLLGMPGNLVAAVPDGVIDDPSDRARLVEATAHVVWLRCSIPILARRMASRWGADAPTLLRKLTADRVGLYEEVADQVVDTDAQPAGAVANVIMDALA